MNGGYFIIPEELYNAFPDNFDTPTGVKVIPGISSLINDAFKSGKPMYMSVSGLRGYLVAAGNEEAESYALYGSTIVNQGTVWARVDIVFSVFKTGDRATRNIFVTPLGS